MIAVGFVPIAATRVDWVRFLEAAQSALGRSVSASLDARGLPVQGVAPFVSAIAEFAAEDADPVDALRRGRCDHIQHTFLIALPHCELLALAASNLRVTPADYEQDFAVVSGRLNEWIAFTAEHHESRNLRELAARLVIWFEQQDLGEAWGAFEKNYGPDGLFHLVRKARA